MSNKCRFKNQQSMLIKTLDLIQLSEFSVTYTRQAILTPLPGRVATYETFDWPQ